MAHQTREVAAALGAGQRDGGDLEGLTTEGDGSARADHRSRVEDPGVPDRIGATLDDVDPRLGHRSDIAAAPLGEVGVREHRGSVAHRADGAGADALAVGVFAQPLAIVEADGVVGVDQRGVGKGEVATSGEEDLRAGDEVPDFLGGHGVS